jgi:hypothetical protein
MSNKQQLQINNTKVASLVEILKNKAIPSGEDVTEETTAYTTKISQLETAVAALESELEGKASGGSGGGTVETCTVTLSDVTESVNWYYTDASMTLQNFVGTGTLTVAINTMLAYQAPSALISVNYYENCSPVLYLGSQYGVVHIYGNCRFQTYDNTPAAGN